MFVKWIKGIGMVRRLFVFAAWDRDNIVDGALLFYLRALYGLYMAWLGKCKHVFAQIGNLA